MSNTFNEECLMPLPFHKFTASASSRFHQNIMRNSPQKLLHDVLCNSQQLSWFWDLLQRIFCAWQAAGLHERIADIVGHGIFEQLEFRL